MRTMRWYKTLAVIMALVLVALFNVSVYADAPSDANGDEPIAIEDGKQIFQGGGQREGIPLPQQKPEDLARQAERLSVADEAFDVSGNGASARVTYTMNVPSYPQENSWYCGPAVVKQLVQYYRGVSSSQASYAANMGTTQRDGTMIGQMQAMLNRTCGGTQWDLAYSPSAARFYSMISYGAITSKIPAVLLLNTTNSWEFGYYVNGHYVNTSGYNNSGLRIRITEPWSGGTHGAGNTWYPRETIHYALMYHWAQIMLW